MMAYRDCTKKQKSNFGSYWMVPMCETVSAFQLTKAFRRRLLLPQEGRATGEIISQSIVSLFEDKRPDLKWINKLVIEGTLAMADGETWKRIGFCHGNYKHHSSAHWHPIFFLFIFFSTSGQLSTMIYLLLTLHARAWFWNLRIWFNRFLSLRLNDFDCKNDSE